MRRSTILGLFMVFGWCLTLEGRVVNFRAKFYWPSDGDGIDVALGQHIDGVRFVVRE